MRFEVIKGFATDNECAALNAWSEEALISGWLDAGRNPEGLTRKRLTTRWYGHRFIYHQVAIDLRRRVQSLFNLPDSSLVLGLGRDGIVTTYMLPGGYHFEHKDKSLASGMAVLRCNVLTQAAESGGVLHVEGQPVDINVGDLHCYLVSEHVHHVTPVQGDTPRILWMFGAHVPAEDWNSGKIHA